jgi:hypothetical protein
MLRCSHIERLSAPGADSVQFAEFQLYGSIGAPEFAVPELDSLALVGTVLAAQTQARRRRRCALS